MEAWLTRIINDRHDRCPRRLRLVLVDVHIQGVDAVSVFRPTAAIVVIVIVIRIVIVHEVALWFRVSVLEEIAGSIPHGGEIAVST